MTRSEKRSSSCAQHRRRARHGDDAVALGDRLGAAREGLPAACGQARWTSASSVAGATSPVSRSSARPTGRGPRRLIAPPPPQRLIAPPRRRVLEHAPVRDRDPLDRVVLGAGHVREVGGGDHALAAAAQHLDEPLAAAGVELAHDVVEQHQRRRPALRGQHLALGQQQREQPEPLLPARPVGAQLAAGAAEARARRGAGRGR